MISKLYLEIERSTFNSLGIDQQPVIDTLMEGIGNGCIQSKRSWNSHYLSTSCVRYLSLKDLVKGYE